MEMFDTIKKKYNKNNKNKGFTLIELLAVIAILSVIMTIVIYAAISIVDNAKEKSYEVTINNIENEASSYVSENQSKMTWMDLNDAKQKQYICVTVQDLIDMGYFKSDVLDSYIEKDVKVSNKDYIYLQRDGNSKTIEKEILLSENSSKRNLDLCNEFGGIGRINIKVEPSGWAKSKDIDIEYILTNVVGNLSDYTYYYKYVDENNGEKILENSFDSMNEKEDFIVNKNGIVIAEIYDKDGELIASEILNIGKIDNEGPVIKDNYSGNTVVNNSVSIPIKVTDVGVGVDGDSFTKEDLEIKIGDKLITDGIELNKIDDNNYILEINNSTDSGELEIIVKKDTVFDKLENPNDETVIDTGISFNNKYTISYNANGGTGTIGDQTVGYGSKVTIASNKFVKEGYTFVGWTTKSDGTDDGYNWTGWSGTWKYTNGQYGIEDNNLVLYARWRVNVVSIKYDVNGGNIKGNSSYGWTTTDGIVYQKDGTTLMTQVSYGNSLSSSGLVNYNNSEYLNIAKTGYTVTGGAEWICSSGNCSNEYYSQSKVYSAGDLCDVTDGDCSITLKVNWKLESYSISYNANGGTGSMEQQVLDYGSKVTISSNKFTRDGYTFVGWTTNSDGTDDGYDWTEWSGTWKYTNGQYGIKNNNLVLYARWRVNVIKIRYDVNDGKITSSTTSSGGTTYKWTTNSGVVYKDGVVLENTLNYGSKLGSSGLVNYNNSKYLYITRTGYTVPGGEQWTCSSGNCIKSTYNQDTEYSASDLCDASKGDCTITLKVNWKLGDYSISYNANGGTGSMSSQSFKFNSTVTIKSNEFKRDGYTFVGWTTNSDGTDDGYGWTNWSGKWIYTDESNYGIKNNNLVLYARWKVNVIKVRYDVNGGTIEGSDSYNWSTKDGLVYKDGSVFETTLDYDKTLGSNGLINYNNTGYLNIIKTGYTVSSGAQWTCSSGNCLNNTYDQDTVYSASDLCDASKGDCTITLKVNWKLGDYSISYNANGGTGSMSSQSFKFNSTVTIKSNEFKRTGYTFVGWTTNSNGTDDGYNWTGWSGTWKYTNGQYGIKNNNLVLYARWEDKTAPTTPSITTIYDLWGTRNYTINGYSSDAGTSGTWTTNGIDPQISFDDIGNINGVTGAFVELEEALTKDVIVQIFYENGDTGFNSTNQEEGVLLEAGETELYIPITKSGTWTKIRFDIGDVSGLSYRIKHLGVSATAGQWNNDDKILKVVTTENGTGVNYWQYTYSSSASATGSDSSTSWVTYGNSASTNFFTPAYTAERNQYAYIRACDKKGNCSSKTNTYIRIDKTKPKINDLVVAYNLFPTKSVSGSQHVSITDTKIKTTGTDPYMYFSGLSVSNVKKAIITLNTALSSSLKFQVFYATSGIDFSEGNSITVNAASGVKTIEVDLPGGNYTALRFDFGTSSGVTYDIQGIDIVGKNVGSVAYIHANITDATNKVSEYKVSKYSTNPSNFTDIDDVKTYHLRNSVTSIGNFYIWGVDNVGSGNMSNVSSIEVLEYVYSITYNLKGGTAGSNAPTSGVGGNSVTVSNPSKPGYTFTGWTVSGTGASISGTSLKIGSSNITLTANWTANLVEYIEYLYNDSSLRASNFLEKDNTGDANIRYVNSNPNNYVKFNGELWRIIGTFNVSNGSTTTKRAKLVRNSSLLSASWDSSASNVNNGQGVNEWSQADIKNMLNTYYIGTSSTCTYCNGRNQSSCSNSCNTIVSKLNSTALGMIENTVWNLGALKLNSSLSALSIYNGERGTTTSKGCSGNVECTDTVTRNLSWTGKVGLIYSSDYAYASTNSSCRSAVHYNGNCMSNNWLSIGEKYWSITPRVSSTFANAVYYINEANGIVDTVAMSKENNSYIEIGIRPSVYLKSSVQVIDGEGTSSNPYILDMLD